MHSDLKAFDSKRSAQTRDIRAPPTSGRDGLHWGGVPTKSAKAERAAPSIHNNNLLLAPPCYETVPPEPSCPVHNGADPSQANVATIAILCARGKPKRPTVASNQLQNNLLACREVAWEPNGGRSGTPTQVKQLQAVALNLMRSPPVDCTSEHRRNGPKHCMVCSTSCPS